VNTLHTRKTS